MTAPAARLLAAADLLDKLAGEAMPGPWAPAGREGEWERPIVMETLTENNPDPEEQQQNFVVAEMRHGYTWQADAAYIATMHPEVGKALAKVLRAEAKRLKRTERLLAFGGAPLFKPEPDTLALADLLLAGGS